ncbi:MAG TPA: hypothetical protein VGR07_08405 [Thermoanaerobaculia bacterium]|jgi:hypothetical protein|nr:hypothetical protein [Thermoanaerobaculia bacterium]
MSNRFRCTAAGVGLALTLALSATSAVQAVPARGHYTVRAQPATAGQSLLSIVWSYLVGGDPRVPHTSQGPTVDPNGVH